MSRHSGITWPFPTEPDFDSGDAAEVEPTDAELGGAVTDPFDSPSYATLT